MDRAEELRAELRQIAAEQQETKRRAALEAERQFRASTTLEVYAASDYAGAAIGAKSFYYGYEWEWCPEHGFTEHNAHSAVCERDDIEWAFWAHNRGRLEAQYKTSELWFQPGLDVLFYLVAGITRFLGEGH